MSRLWMPLYIGDFLADTMDLGATERGIYISLIMHCWQHGTIPRDDRRLARIAGCDSRLWHQYRETTLQFFDVVDASTMQHPRVTKELHRYAEISNKRKAAALQKHSKSSASVVHLHTQSQSPLKERKKDAANAAPATPEAGLFERATEVLGKGSGGLIKKLLIAKGGNVALARAAIEQASTKYDAREYIGRILSNSDPPAGQAVTYVDPRL